ncbi:hypothetical protein C8R46DRAFT_1147046 [Mycena filopes]|nr:hypothetical protein C8R46DRAFT_1147046 [Mycena filopes]
MLASKFRSSCVAVVTVPATLTRVSVAASRVLSSSRRLSSIFSTSLSRSASDASVPVASQLAAAIAIGGVTVSPRHAAFHGARTTHLSGELYAPASETALSAAVVCFGTRPRTRDTSRRNCPASCRRRSVSCDRS